MNHAVWQNVRDMCASGMRLMLSYSEHTLTPTSHIYITHLVTCTPHCFSIQTCSISPSRRQAHSIDILHEVSQGLPHGP